MNKFFSVVTEQRTNEKTKQSSDVTVIYYRDMKLAIFAGENQQERVGTYLNTYGYLAEWYRLGTPSWEESMRVDVNG